MKENLFPSERARQYCWTIPLERWEESLNASEAKAARYAVEEKRLYDVEWLSEDLVVARVIVGGINAKLSIAFSADQRVEATCVCSKHYDCEHAVALGIYLQMQAQSLEEPSTWQEVLDGYTLRGADLRTPLGLYVEYVPEHEQIWLTPLRAGTTRPWIKKGVSWSELASPWSSAFHKYPEDQVKLLLEGYQKILQSEYTSAYDVTLSSLGKQAFSWLYELQRNGVTLLCDMHDFTPLVLETGQQKLALRETLQDEGIVLQLTQDEDHPDSADLRRAQGAEAIIADVAVYEGGRVLRSLDPRQEVDHFVSAKDLLIPWQDVGEYLARYAPGLRQAFPRAFGSHYYLDHESLEPSPLGSAPDIVAALTMRDQGRNIGVEYYAEYDVAKRKVRFPLVRLGERNPFGRFDFRLSSTYRLVNARMKANAQARSLWGANDEAEYFESWAFPAYKFSDFYRYVVRGVKDPGLVWDVSGIDVHALSEVPTVDEAATIIASVQPTQDIDWFDLNTVLRIDGAEIPLSVVLMALDHEETHVFISGRWVSLDSPVIRQLRRTLDAAAALAPDEHTPQISRWQAHLWQDLEELVDERHAVPQWAQNLQRLPSSGLLPTLPPLNSAAVSLRSYQKDGHRWLTSLMQAGLGGILADDMGLGKTLQVLSALASYLSEQDQADTGPILVVAPTSVVPVWQAEAQHWYPHLRVKAVTETSKKRGTSLADECEQADIVVTTYGIVRLDSDVFASLSWGGLVLDEAHAVKNPRTAVFKALQKLHRDWSIALTGTPVENSVTDLWAIFRLTCPGLLPRWERFRERFVRPIEKQGDMERAEALRLGVEPFMLRRKKESVARDLPAKTDSVLTVSMEGGARRFYEALLTKERSKILGLLNAGPGGQVEILASLMRLRQAALDPGLVNENFEDAHSAKTVELLNVLGQILPAGHQALVFSQFTSYLDRLEDALRQAKIPCTRLDGTTRQRGKVIEEFRTGEARVFLISLKAGGTGLTLTEADYVFLMDPWWNPAVEEQAIDRAHRIGQQKPVTIYRMVTEGTIEHKVLALQEKKRDIAQALVGDAVAHTGQISAEDIRALVS